MAPTHARLLWSCLLQNISRPGLTSWLRPLRLETTSPRRHCGADPIATQHWRGFVRLRHLPAPGGESACTEEEAHQGMRRAQPQWHLDPRRRQVRGSGVCRLLWRPCESERRGRAGLKPGKNRNVSLQLRSAASLALDYISHRSPRRASRWHLLSASLVIAPPYGPLRWVWRGPDPLKMLAGVLHSLFCVPFFFFLNFVRSLIS